MIRVVAFAMLLAACSRPRAPVEPVEPRHTAPPDAAVAAVVTVEPDAAPPVAKVDPCARPSDDCPIHARFVDIKYPGNQVAILTIDAGSARGVTKARPAFLVDQTRRIPLDVFRIERDVSYGKVQGVIGKDLIHLRVLFEPAL